MSQRTALFVLGMHRSGTSALTRVLNLSGATLPLDLYPAGIGNERGHWEPAGAVELNDAILAAAGTSVNGLAGPDDDWFRTPTAMGFLRQITKLYQAQYGEASLSVIKDPRLSLVLPLWRVALESLGVQCKVVMAVRNPVEVAQSMTRRQALAGQLEPWPMDRGGLLWLGYSLAAERHSRGLPRSICHYDDLLSDWRKVLAQIETDLDLKWPIVADKAAAEIDDFLCVSQRHFTMANRVEVDSALWSQWVRPVYQRLKPGLSVKDAGALTVFDATTKAMKSIVSGLKENASPLASSPVVRGLKVLTRSRHGHGAVCFVGRSFYSPDIKATSSLKLFLQALTQGLGLTLLIPEALSQTEWSFLQALADQQSMQAFIIEDEVCEIQPESLRPCLGVLHYLQTHEAGPVLFTAGEGLAYASVMAKAAGMALADHLLCLVERREGEAQGPTLPANLTPVVSEHLEQLVRRWIDRILVADEPAQVLTDLASPMRSAPRERQKDDLTLSVIITHYERPHLLDQMIQALCRQTDQDFSLVIVDDGSTSAQARDYLSEVAQLYPQLSIRVLYQPNLYVGAARNAGIAAAETSHVILLDDDNLPMPHLVQSLKRAACCTRADVVTCGIAHFSGERPPDHDQGVLKQYFTAGPLLLGLIHNGFGDTTAIYRKAAFEELGGFNVQRGVTYEDWEWHLRAVRSGLSLISLPDVLLWYRVSSDSMLRTTDELRNIAVIEAASQDFEVKDLHGLVPYLIGSERHHVRLNQEIKDLRLQLDLERAVARLALITSA